jgi:hypothetical protein
LNLAYRLWTGKWCRTSRRGRWEVVPHLAPWPLDDYADDLQAELNRA